MFLLIASVFLSGCEERKPALFGDVTGVYFNNRSAFMTVADSLDVTFVYEKEDELVVPVRIQLVGRPADESRPVNVSVTSDNASQGEDYMLPDDPMMPAGASEVDYLVVLKRTESLKHEVKSIHLRIHSNDFFDLPVTEIVQTGDTVSTLDYTILFSDMFTKAPVAWNEDLIGTFSQQKFELVCKVLDIDPADFNDASVITMGKLLYIRAEIVAYIEGEIEKKNAGESYDEDVMDSSTGLPLEF